MIPKNSFVSIALLAVKYYLCNNNEEKINKIEPISLKFKYFYLKFQIFYIISITRISIKTNIEEK